MDYVELADYYAEQYGLNPTIFRRMIMQESGFDPEAENEYSGALGIAQIMEDSARQPGYGVDPIEDRLDPEQSLRFGAQYLRAMLDRYDGDYARALAAYNAGPTTVDRAGGIPDIAETQTYVRNILGSEDIERPMGAMSAQGVFATPEGLAMLREERDPEAGMRMVYEMLQLRRDQEAAARQAPAPQARVLPSRERGFNEGGEAISLNRAQPNVTELTNSLYETSRPELFTQYEDEYFVNSPLGYAAFFEGEPFPGEAAKWAEPAGPMEELLRGVRRETGAEDRVEGSGNPQNVRDLVQLYDFLQRKPESDLTASEQRLLEEIPVYLSRTTGMSEGGEVRPSATPEGLEEVLAEREAREKREAGMSFFADMIRQQMADDASVRAPNVVAQVQPGRRRRRNYQEGGSVEASVLQASMMGRHPQDLGYMAGRQEDFGPRPAIGFSPIGSAHGNLTPLSTSFTPIKMASSAEPSEALGGYGEYLTETYVEPMQQKVEDFVSGIQNNEQRTFGNGAMGIGGLAGFRPPATISGFAGDQGRPPGPFMGRIPPNMFVGYPQSQLRSGIGGLGMMM